MSLNEKNSCFSHSVVDLPPGDAAPSDREPSFHQTSNPPATVSLSLRTRESCALELKRIFDQISANAGKKYLNDSPVKVASDTGLPCAKNQSSSHWQMNSTAENGSDSTTRHAQQGFLPSAISRPNMHNSARQPTAQLTIFYSGTVNVYDDIPADKANAIMLLAGGADSCVVKPTNEGDKDVATTTSLNPSSGMSAFAPLTIGVPTISVTSTIMSSPESSFNKLSTPGVVPCSAINSVYNTHSPLRSPSLPVDAKTQARKPQNGTELPHARKASLVRFLEKRKDRVQVQPQMNEKDGMSREEKDRGPKRLAVKCKETDDEISRGLSTSTEPKALDTVKQYRV